MIKLIGTSSNIHFNEAKLSLPLYVKTKGIDEILTICLYIDDLIYVDNSVVLMKRFKIIMISEFKMTNLSLISYFLGLEVSNVIQGFLFLKRSTQMIFLRSLNWRIVIQWKLLWTIICNCASMMRKKILMLRNN